MRFSNLLCQTLKEVPNDAEVVSHQLMVRSGMIRKVASGIYSLLPLGQRIMQKFMSIVRDEMNRAGAQEVFMPSVIPAHLWEESGRWGQYGPELLRIRDRHGNDYCYGPTHEEVITELVRGTVKSYRQLPVNLYQIQTKFRDEIRPRFGLMRGREFMMKDAYSFHATEPDLAATYNRMAAVYNNIFSRCGLKFKMVEADSGNIGGNTSAEFMVTASTGEDLIIECTQCSYAANIEAAEAPHPTEVPLVASEAYAKVATPGQRSISEVSSFLSTPANRLIKAVMLIADGKVPVMVLIRGDHDANETKIKKALGADSIEMMPEAEVTPLTGAVVGYAGPIGLKPNVKVIADFGIQGISSGVCGANEADAHFKDINVMRDFNISEFYDLRNAVEGDSCCRCQTGVYQYTRGIEVGHIFQLGTKYSEAMNAVFLDQNGKTQPMIMGCYGIGIGRTVAAAIEQNHDEKGIIWPEALAPFQVVIVLGNAKHDESVAVAERLYATLTDAGIECLLDDRAVSIGFKFNDFELIGIPKAIVVGKQFADTGKLEVKHRKGQESEYVTESDVLSVILG